MSVSTSETAATSKLRIPRQRARPAPFNAPTDARDGFTASLPLLTVLVDLTALCVAVGLALLGRDLLPVPNVGTPI